MDLRAAAKVGPDLLDEREELWSERAEREVNVRERSCETGRGNVKRKRNIILTKSVINFFFFFKALSYSTQPYV